MICEQAEDDARVHSSGHGDNDLVSLLQPGVELEDARAGGGESAEVGEGGTAGVECEWRTEEAGEAGRHFDLIGQGGERETRRRDKWMCWTRTTPPVNSPPSTRIQTPTDFGSKHKLRAQRAVRSSDLDLKPISRSWMSSSYMQPMHSQQQQQQPPHPHHHHHHHHHRPPPSQQQPPSASSSSNGTHPPQPPPPPPPGSLPPQHPQQQQQQRLHQPRYGRAVGQAGHPVGGPSVAPGRAGASALVGGGIIPPGDENMCVFLSLLSCLAS